MIIPEDRRRIATIIAKKRKSGEEKIGPAPIKNEIVKTEDGEPDGRHIAAQEMLMAFHEKSAAKLMKALSNFLDLHEATEEQEEG